MAEARCGRAHIAHQVPPNESSRLMGRQGIDHHLRNHDQTIIAKAMTSPILTKTRSTLRSLSRFSSLRSRGSGRFVGIIGSLLRFHPHSLMRLIALRTPVSLSCASSDRLISGAAKRTRPADRAAAGLRVAGRKAAATGAPSASLPRPFPSTDKPRRGWRPGIPRKWGRRLTAEGTVCGRYARRVQKD